MLDVFNFPTPQSANYQEFYGGIIIGRDSQFTWTKPRGASMVRFLLIGAGAGGANGNTTAGGGGGGSGSTVSWIGPAIFVPDILQIRVGRGGNGGVDGDATGVYYYSPVGAYELLLARGGITAAVSSGGSGGTAMPANYFTASGIFNSVSGQSGANGSASSAGANSSASSTTFLSGGAGGSGGSLNVGGAVTPNYGYTTLPTTTAGGTVKGADGYFITQPILVGTGGAGGTTNTTGTGTTGGAGGIGCGGGGAGEDNSGGQYERRGGDGAVFVWAW